MVVSEQEVAAHSATADTWYGMVREHAARHSQVVQLELTTENFLGANRSTWRPLLNSTLWSTRSLALDRPSRWSVATTPAGAIASNGAAIPDGATNPLKPPSRTSRSAQCDLCSEQWLFILSTGRSGSTSILEALNSLPGVHLRGENQASLDIACELYERYREGLARERVVRHSSRTAAMEHGTVQNQSLLCSMQSFFRGLLGSEYEGAPPPFGSLPPSAPGMLFAPGHGVPPPDGQPATPTVGFKELLSLRARSTEYDHDGRAPPARHLPIDLDDDAYDVLKLSREARDGRAATLVPVQAPHWLTFLRALFPCARVILNTRRNTTAQALSAFHKRQGTSPSELNALNAAVGQIRALLGPAVAYDLPMEDFSPGAFTALAHWLGFARCEFEAIPRANDATAEGAAGSEYHADYERVRVRCGDDRRSHDGADAADLSKPPPPRLLPSSDVRSTEEGTRTSPQEVASARSAVAMMDTMPPLAALLTLGIKHTSDYRERRSSLSALLQSIHEAYPALPVLVIYDGAYVYNEDAMGTTTAARRDHEPRFIRLTHAMGLAAGRNAIADHATTPYVMIMVSSSYIIYASSPPPCPAYLHASVRSCL